jgi:hypothetical protein
MAARLGSSSVDLVASAARLGAAPDVNPQLASSRALQSLTCGFTRVSLNPLAVANMGMTYRNPPLFRVRYRFLSADEGGRASLPKQGWRAAFQYEGEPSSPYYEVWPLFESGNGETLPELAPVPAEGTALMHVLHDEEIPFHRKMAQPGARCIFVEGGRPVAKATVIQAVAGATSN